MWLTPAQLAIVEAELARACATLDASALEAAAFFLSDCLLRARAANNRVPSWR